MDDQVTIKAATDPKAPTAFDLTLASKLVRTARNLQRSPSGDIIQDYAAQLAFAIAEIGSVATKITNAENATQRYQKEAENANAEVRVMQAEVAKIREGEAGLKAKIDALAKEIAELRAPKVVATGKAVKGKRGPKAKIVPMEKAAAQ